MKLDFYLLDPFARIDLDNLIREALNLLQDVGLLTDDKLVANIEATKHKAIDLERFTIEIYRWSEERWTCGECKGKFDSKEGILEHGEKSHGKTLIAFG